MWETKHSRDTIVLNGFFDDDGKQFTARGGVDGKLSKTQATENGLLHLHSVKCDDGFYRRI